MEQVIMFALIAMGVAFIIAGISFIILIVSELREMKKEDE